MVPGKPTGDTAPMRVAVLDDYQRRAEQFADWESLGRDVVVSFFHAPIERAELPTTLADFDALVLMRERTRIPQIGARAAAPARAARHDRHAQRVGRRRLPARPRRRRVRHRTQRRVAGPRGAEHGRGRVGADLRDVQARDDRGPGAARRRLAARPAAQPGRRHAGPRRSRTARCRDGGPGAGVRDGRHCLEREPDRSADGGGGRGQGLQGRAARTRRRALHPPRAQRPHPGPVRRRRPGADEVLRGPDQHLPWPDRRRAGADRGTAIAVDRRRRAGRVRPRAAARETTNCWRSTTRCSSRTWGT